MHIAQNGIAGRTPTPPRRGWAGTGRFIPDDFTPHEEPNGQHLFNDETVQRDVRLPPQISQVDAGAPPGNQHTENLLPDPHQHRQIFIQGQVFIIFLTGVVGGGGDHQVHALVRKVVHTFTGSADDLVQAAFSDGIFVVRRSISFPQVFIHTAAVKTRRIVAGVPGRPKSACLCPANFFIIHDDQL